MRVPHGESGLTIQKRTNAAGLGGIISAIVWYPDGDFEDHLVVDSERFGAVTSDDTYGWYKQSF